MNLVILNLYLMENLVKFLNEVACSGDETTLLSCDRSSQHKKSVLVMAVLKILESDAQVCTQNCSIIEFIFIA